jgi:pyruvate dehydrogenase E1 component alpha subunit
MEFSGYTYLCQAANLVFMAQVKEKKAGTQATAGSNGIDSGTYRQWYETMVRIRKFEERALKMYSVNKIRGFLHVYIGQEAIAAAITSALRPTDPIVTATGNMGLLCVVEFQVQPAWLSYLEK